MSNKSASAPAARSASVERNTKETQISVTINLDGTGQLEVDTGLPFWTTCWTRLPGTGWWI